MPSAAILAGYCSVPFTIRLPFVSVSISLACWAALLFYRLTSWRGTQKLGRSTPALSTEYSVLSDSAYLRRPHSLLWHPDQAGIAVKQMAF
jgi:hypothetical protein